MTKKLPKYDDEIDLFDLIKSIWEGKFQIILITFVATAIGLIFNYYQNYNQKEFKTPDTFEIILNIKPSKNLEFIEFFNLNELIAQNRIRENIFITEIDRLKIYNKFIEEFKSYKKLKSILKNNTILKKTFSDLSEENQQYQLHKYLRLFSIKKPNDKKDEHVIKFRWNNIDEGKKILEEMMILMMVNLEKSIFNEVFEILKIEKEMDNENNLSKIEFLLEQSAIAKAIELDKPSSAISTMKDTYYLHGYIAIDKEIDLIRSRSNKKIDYILKKMKNLENNNEINWISYDIFDVSFIKISQLPNNIKQVMIIPITILGLIIGIFYILIVNKLSKSMKVSRKK